jgi:hypothetical protein
MLQEVINDRENSGSDRIEVSTLVKSMEFEVIARQRTTDPNQQHISPEEKAAQRDHATCFLQYQHMTFVSVDEFGFNLSTQRHYDWALISQWAFRLIPANPLTNVSVLAAIQKECI